jgi:hypothetical protein
MNVNGSASSSVAEEMYWLITGTKQDGLFGLGRLKPLHLIIPEGGIKNLTT